MTKNNSGRLPLWTKLIYGSGEFGPSSIGMMRSLFFVIYLTDTVGLDPRLASLGAIVGLIWDAINDPLVGMFSDRVKSRWGRRRPFLLIFSIPFGASFVAMWSAPNWDSQIALTVYVTLAFMLVDTFGTLTTVPYLSLTPELTQEYDERTVLSGFRTAFQLVGSFSVVITAPLLIDSAIESGLSQQHGYQTAGAVFGFLAAFFFLGVFLFIRERNLVDELPESVSIFKLLKIAWSNIPFRFVMGIFLLNWTALDLVAVVFPFYLLYWMAKGNLLAKVNIFGLNLALESAFFGVLMFVCILSVPFWIWISRRRNKRDAYVAGMIYLVVILFLIFFVQPEQMNTLLVLGALAGFGVSAAYVLPDAMFPDIIEWDELRTRHRQEGIYYGARNFIRRVTMALVMFLTLQLLGWTGYQTPPPDVVEFLQPRQALLTIRILISLVSVVMLSGAALLTWFNPMTREKNDRIRNLIDRRKARIVQLD
ncbi:MAG: MFS transporter [Anaerolineales bacterium]|nr:MFS transporter [Chloroflexota bacterium]MBL6980821.1 MFS transporter [Anaerolineales bacterium]